MASLSGHILKELLHHSQRFAVQLSRQGTGVRNIYARASLGIDGFEKTRERVRKQFVELEDRFKTKMSEFIAPESTSLIFTEDFKNMINLAQTDQDITLLEEMMKKFHKQNKDVRFGSFVFGPVVLRMYYTLNKPDEAFKAFTSPELVGFFDQLMSIQLLGDLLLINGKYEEIFELFEMVKSRQLEQAKYPRNLVVILFAALYKMNTPESLAKAQAYYKELIDFGHYPLRRAITLFGALALKQNNPSLALELSTGKQQNYITMRAIRIEALSQLGRPDDVLPILRNLLVVDDPTRPRRSVPRESFNKVEEAINKVNNPDLNHEFESLSKQLKENNSIEDVTLESHLMKDIEPLQYRDDRYGGRRDRFERDDHYGDRDRQRSGERFDRDNSYGDRQRGNRFERGDSYGDRQRDRRPSRPSIRDMS